MQQQKRNENHSKIKPENVHNENKLLEKLQ